MPSLADDSTVTGTRQGNRHLGGWVGMCGGLIKNDPQKLYRDNLVGVGVALLSLCQAQALLLSACGPGCSWLSLQCQECCQTPTMPPPWR